MTYVKTGPFIDYSGTPGLSAEWANAVENSLVSLTAYTAPPPSGSDDTTVLQNLLNLAEATGGTLVLGPGTYLANLATNQAFTQPRIVGQGMNLTTIQGTVNTSPVVRFKGGSGGFSGGHVQDLTITAAGAGGGIGLQLADSTGVTWTRVHFTGALAEGIQFLNESSGGFAEYNHGDAIFEPAVVLPVHYKVTGGNASFHGSGLTHGTVINQSASTSGPMIRIDSGAFVYAAPLTAALFPSSANVPLILNSNTANPASFFGTIDVEADSAGPLNIGDTTGNRILLAGNVIGLAASQERLGSLYLVDRVYYLGGNTFSAYKPLHRTTTLASGTTAVLPDGIGTCTVQIDIVAPNYHYAYLLHCWQSPYNSGGTVTVVTNPEALNTAGYGAPTFAWTNYGLSVTNASYTTSVVAYLSVQPLANPVAADVLGQY